jgi:hypothetical protein
MLAFKIALYTVTLASAFLFGFWENKLFSELTDGAEQEEKNVSQFGFFNDISNRIKRRRFLKTLSPEMTFKYKVIVGMKFLCMAMLIAEVLVLQR